MQIDPKISSSSGRSELSAMTAPTGKAAPLTHSGIPRTGTNSSLRTVLAAAVISALALLGVTENLRRSAANNGSIVEISSSWLRQHACHCFGICRQSNHSRSKWKGKIEDTRPWRRPHNETEAAKFWTSGTEDETRWSAEERRLREIPQFVLDHAPYVHLYSGEEFWPCDIAEHLQHTTPHIDFTPVRESLRGPTLDNLDDLNEFGRTTYLQSDDNVEDNPEWLGGESNIPSEGEEESWSAPNRRAYRPRSSAGVHPQEDERTGGKSDAPVVLVVIDKGDDIVDAFWFYFYSYNLGNTFFGVRFGNHVGDWEHTAIRFQKGEPISLFFSEHSWGEAYSWGAVEKIGNRPVSYSAAGTHAMYGSSGTHEYVLPFGLLYDVTDKGPLWDPRLNMHAYTYDLQNRTLRASTLNPKSPINWFYFLGHWGDKTYPLSDPRQYKFAGQNHYVSGPYGPRYKRLARKHICQSFDDEPCDIRTKVAPTTKVWKPAEDGDEFDGEELRRWAAQNRAREQAR